MERKAVKFITVFILSLMLVVTCPLLGFQSEAANSRVFIEQYPSANGHAKTPSNLYVGFGETLTYTLSFSGYTKPVAGSKMYFYFFSPLFRTLNNSNSADNFYTVWVDNWRMTIGGETYKASFLNDLNDMRSLSGSIPSVFNVPLSSNPSLNYTIECDVHIRLNTAALLPNQEVILNETHTGQSTSTSTTNSSTGKTTTNTDESGRGTIRGYISEAIPPVKICPVVEVELGHSNDTYFDYVESSSVSDSVQQQLTQQQTDVIKDQTQQQHSDAQDQLKESQKQTDAMTKFDGKSDMDKNSSDLNDSLSGYDEAQQSIFSSSTASIEKFDVDNLFNFTANISAALLVWNNLMVSIVASMGDFSLIYTISMGLVFIGIVVGIWRFFVK